MRSLAPVALSLVLGAFACSARTRKDEPAMTDGKQAMTDEALIRGVLRRPFSLSSSTWAL